MGKLVKTRTLFFTLSVAIISMCMIVFTNKKLVASEKNVNIESDTRILAIINKGIHSSFSGNNTSAAKAFESISKIDPTHPAREFFLATILMDASILDFGEDKYDNQIRKLLDECRKKAIKRLKDSPNDLIGLHYLGMAEIYEGRILAMRGHYFRGGLRGEKGRKILEKAKEFHPEAVDLRFPLGAYYYFASLLPDALQRMNFLPFIPKGGREQGINEIRSAEKKSVIHLYSARYLLGVILLHADGHEKESLSILESMAQEFPNNPYIGSNYANALVANGHLDKARNHAMKLLDGVRIGLPLYDEPVKCSALLTLVHADILESDTISAKDKLQQLRKSTTIEKTSLAPWADLYEGMIFEIEGDREIAVRFYKQAQDYDRRRRNLSAKLKARKYEESPYSPNMFK